MLSSFKFLLALASGSCVYSLYDYIKRLNSYRQYGIIKTIFKKQIDKNGVSLHKFDYDETTELLYNRYKIMLYTEWIETNDIDDKFKQLKKQLNRFMSKGFGDFIYDDSAVYLSFNDKDTINEFLSLRSPSHKNSIKCENHQLFVINEAHYDITLIVKSYVL